MGNEVEKRFLQAENKRSNSSFFTMSWSFMGHKNEEKKKKYVNMK